MRMCRLGYRKIGPKLGCGRQRAWQIVHQTYRRNKWIIARLDVSLDDYLFKKHGYGGRQYRPTVSILPTI